MLGIIPSSQPDYYPMLGTTEMAVARDVASAMKAYLDSQGVPCRVYLSNTYAASDAARQAVAEGCSAYLSIHFDAGVGSPNKSLACYSVAANTPFAGWMLDKFCSKMGHTSRGLQHRGPPNGIHPWPSVILIPSQAGYADAVLLELLTMDVASDAEKIKNPAWRQKAGEALAQAYMEWAGISEEGDEDGMIYVLDKMPKEANGKYVWVGSDAIVDRHGFSVCFLNIYHEIATDAPADMQKPANIEIYTSPPHGVAGLNKIVLNPRGRYSLDLHALFGNPPSGFSVIVKCDKPNISPTLTFMKE